MGKVYAAPEHIEKPNLRNFLPDVQDFFKEEEKYVERIKQYCRKQGKGKYAGEEIAFPVADGYARYAVFSLRPVTLIHIDAGDAWQFEYADRLNSDDIKDKIKKHKHLAKLFGGK